LMLIGIVLLLAASPPVAIRLKLDPFYFVHRQGLFLVPAMAVLFATSALSPRQVPRPAPVRFLISPPPLAPTLGLGPEIQGARRWLNIFDIGLQPSEFLKPAFVVLVAWAFSESSRQSEMPAALLAFVLLVLPVILLLQQPDFGQTVLLTLTWGALFF